MCKADVQRDDVDLWRGITMQPIKLCKSNGTNPSQAHQVLVVTLQNLWKFIGNEYFCQLLCMITCRRYDNKTKGAKVMFELEVFMLREKHKFRTVQE